ncbi:hypothetical protein HQ47_09185 [Porphyromonas macacae]|uniref:Uncharacterized protein n=2 Tax=Porphyromonas macacae TaxID=28115 RepID=A0A0A2E6G0_9PORP|nr:hypothetical protein HQ47_09185 [Porphyromonas macacae]
MNKKPNIIDKSEFLERLRGIHSATSKTEMRYTSIHIENEEVCIGTRESTGKHFKIIIDRLYNAYYELKVSGIKINTTTLKKYVNGVQSPSLAILKEMKLVN